MKNLLFCCVFSAFLGGLAAVWVVKEGADWSAATAVHAQQLAPPANTVQSVARTPSATLAGLTPEETTNIRVYEGANRGVVNIDTRTVSFDRFFMMPSPGQGSGSGSVLNKHGHILTNFHVVENAREIQVTLPGGKAPYPAELVGRDAEHDIAVLRIDAPADELHPVPLGSSDNLKVGQRVYTLGNPFGLEGTLTTGIISNLNRTLPSRMTGREMKSIIQTDAAMNPGNSGGPLLDTRGQMVGMNVAIATKTGQSAGVGFAIPINRIRQIVPELIQHGKVVRADIGIVAVMETDEGLQIVRTNKGGPADQAGLRGWAIVRRQVSRGPLVYNVEREDRSHADVILAVNGEQVESASAFVEKIELYRPGDRVELTILREGRRQLVEVTLGRA